MHHSTMLKNYLSAYGIKIKMVSTKFMELGAKCRHVRNDCMQHMYITLIYDNLSHAFL